MVKCADCGFLTLKDDIQDRFIEVDEQYRNTGTLLASHAHYGCRIQPICFLTRYNLPQEYDDCERPTHEKILEVLQKERDCNTDERGFGFTRFLQGFTPKGHYEMINGERLFKIEQQQREWIAEQRRLDIEYRDKKDQADKEWRSDQEQKTKGQFIWSLIVLGIIASLIVSAATIIAAFISRG
ncbi:MAG: hypothetical protein TUN42_03230 [Dehalogenimonas sp.]